MVLRILVDKSIPANSSHNACNYSDVRYFMKGEKWILRLLIDGVKGSGLTGRLAAALQKSYIGRRSMFLYLKLMGGKKLITFRIV